MGNMKIRLLTAVLFFACISLGSFSENPLAPVHAGAPPNSPYTGSGGVLDVFEFARNDSGTFTDGVNATAFNYDASWFPSGYGGYQLVTSVSNLARTEDPIPNGDFDKYNEDFHIAGSDINHEVHNWTLTQNGKEPYNDANRILSSIDNNTGGTPGDCMDITLRYGWTRLTTAIAYLESDFEYTSAISPSILAFSFDIKFSNDITQQNWLYVNVSLEYQATLIASWQQTTDTYHPTNWDHHSTTTTPINGTVTLRITVMKQGGSKWSYVNGHIYFDNFRYVLDTPSKPSEVALKLNGETLSDTGAQTGSIILYADPANHDEVPIANCWITTQNYQFTSSFNITFHYAYAMYIKHQSSTSATTSFSAPVDANPTWEINYSIPSDQPPSGHIGYSFGVYLEPLWSLSEVRNDTGQVITTYSYNASSRFVKLDDGIAQSEDTFSIIATSVNYILQMYLQKSTTGLGNWANVSTDQYFVAGEWIRAKALLRPIESGGHTANVSIFYPNQTLWQSDTSPTFHEHNETLTSEAWQIPSIRETDAGGAWLATVAYHNATQSGMLQHSFAVVIPSRGTKISPSEQQRVIWDESVLVNVTWQNNDTLEYIPDASARVRYVDRNLHVQYEPMIANGFGAYSLVFDTGAMSPGQSVEIYVELFRYGFVNATYDDSTHLTLVINLVNDLEYVMIKPTQLTGPDEYTSETTRDQGYTSQVRFYDPFRSAYVLNETSLWPTVLVQYAYYEDTGSGFGSPLLYGSFSQNYSTRIFEKHDASYAATIVRVKYIVTMRVEDASWEFEQQNFTIIIKIVSFATNLDAVRTQIEYPPTGTGDGWTQFENDTDVYTAHVYWNELLNITVCYINESTSNGITGATVKILIGFDLTSLAETSNGYYYYSLNSTILGLGQTDVYINATQIAHATQTIKIRISVESRATQLTKDHPRSTAEIPYDDDFIVRFNYTDIVTGSSTFISDATILIDGYEAGKYSIQNYLNGTYAITFWGNITETTYDVTIYFSRTNYTTQNQYFAITISSIKTYASGSAITGSVPWGDNVTLVLLLNDTDHGYIGIDNALIGFSWLDDIQGIDYWIIDHGNGTYTVTLNTSKVSTGLQSFTINFVFTKIHYETAQVAISFQVRDRLTALYITAIDPGTSVPWGDALKITLTFNDTDHDFNSILGATFTCDWDEFYWSYFYNATSGAYILTIRTESRLEGSYTIHIYASKGHYQTFMTLQSFVSRNIQTNYQADPLFIPSQPWGDNLTIRVHYLDLDHGGYIPFAEIETNWNESYYTIYWLGNGTYLIEINTTCRDIGTHLLQITLNRSHYTQQIIEIDLTLRNILTDININPAYIWSHPWGDNITIQIEYLDQDHNGYVVNAILTVDWNATFYTIYNLGNGTYLIILNTTCREAGTYYLQINLSQLHYVSQLIDIALTLRNIQTGYTVNPSYIPSNPWGDNITIRIDYMDFDHSTYISGALLTTDWNASYYSIYDLGNGTYLIEVNTTCREIGSHSIGISVSLEHYVSQNLQVDLILRNIQTDFEAENTVFPSHPWGDNVTVRLDYLDIDHDTYVSNALITTNWNISYYSIYSYGNGTYLIKFNTTCRDNGLHFAQVTLTWSHYASQNLQVRITLRDVQTDTDANPLYVSSHAWGVNLTVQIDYQDTDHGDYVIGAILTTNWDLGYYTIYDFQNGTYIVELNTTSRDVGTHMVIITLNSAHYESQQVSVEFTLRGRNTQVSYTPPQPIPYLANLTFTIFYNDTDTTTAIQNVTGNVHIALACTSHPALSLNYTVIMINNGNNGYLITILTNNFDQVNVWYRFLINVTWSNIAPYYQNHSLPISGYVRSIQTTLELDFDSFVYWGDLLYLNATYRDIDNDIVLFGGSVTVWLSWASWSIVQIYPDGTYLLQINSSAEDIGLANFTIRFSESNYDTSEQSVQFTINPLPLHVEVLSTSPWTAEYQTAVNISVRVTDEYNRLMNNTQVTYYWAGLTPANLVFMGGGVYNITFLANQSVGTYLVTIEASNLPNYQTSIGIIMLNILPIDSLLTVQGPGSPVVAGDSFQVSANFSTLYGAALPNATVYFNWAGGNATLTYDSGYTFTVMINSSGLDAGQYTIYITASHPNVIEQLRTISVSLIVMPAYLESDTPVILVEWGENFTVLVEFHDNNLQPITGANIQYNWGNLTGFLKPTGLSGWYNISLPSDIFAVGVYQLTLSCDHEGYQYAMASIGLNIQPRQTSLIIDEITTELEEAGIIIPLNGTAWDVPRGDILRIYFNFTDTNGQVILNATGSYSWQLGSGVLQFRNGFYFAQINLTDVTPGLYSLTISLTRQNFETATAPYLQLNVIPVPTEITGLSDTITIFTGEAFTLHVTFTDTYHNIVITDATLYVSIPSLGLDLRPMMNNGDGTYTLAGLSALVEGTSSIIIESSAAPKYAQTQSTATLIVSLSPVTRTAIQAAALLGVILIISLLIWLAYARVYSIPWIVRKMRKMSKSIDRGQTPSLSKSEINRLPNRDTQLVTMMSPSYEASSLTIQPYVLPTAELPTERRSEDDAILLELEQLEGLGENQKEQLFEQMKKIPAKDRVWFMEDMKRQMAEGRFDYLKTGDAEVEEEAPVEERPEKPGLSPVEQATLVAVLREGLDQFTVIGDGDKDALVQQLIIMTPEEREATIKKLMARMKGLQLEEPEPKPKLKKRKKKADFDTSES
ncbi:MAG: hypothetical protein ACFFDU_02655 [Candidatus Thorarchaeota archaeon]